MPGSPFTCVVMDTDSVALTGEGLRSAPANATTSFRVDPKGAGDFDLRAWVVCEWIKFNLFRSFWLMCVCVCACARAS